MLSVSLLGQATKEDKTDSFISDPIKSIILGQRRLGQVSKEEKVSDPIKAITLGQRRLRQVSKEEKVRQLFVSGQLQKEERVSRVSNTKSLDGNAYAGNGKIAKEEKVKQLWLDLWTAHERGEGLKS